MFSAFGVLALVIAAIGLYGVLAFVTVILLLVAAAASSLPAWRTARVDHVSCLIEL